MHFITLWSHIWVFATRNLYVFLVIKQELAPGTTEGEKGDAVSLTSTQEMSTCDNNFTRTKWHLHRKQNNNSEPGRFSQWKSRCYFTPIWLRHLFSSSDMAVKRLNGPLWMWEMEDIPVTVFVGEAFHFQTPSSALCQMAFELNLIDAGRVVGGSAQLLFGWKCKRDGKLSSGSCKNPIMSLVFNRGVIDPSCLMVNCRVCSIYKDETQTNSAVNVNLLLYSLVFCLFSFFLINCELVFFIIPIWATAQWKEIAALQHV